MSFRYGADALAELQLVLDEGVDASRVRVSGIDRTGAGIETLEIACAIAHKGAYVGIDNVGVGDDKGDKRRVELIKALIADGHRDRVLLASNSVGVAI